MKMALDNIHNSTKADGGFMDKKSRAEFRKVVGMRITSASIIDNITNQIVNRQFQGLRESLDLGNLEHITWENFLTLFLNTDYAILILTVTSVVIFAGIMYIAYSCLRCCKVCERRHNIKDKISTTNYLWAMINHTQVDSNVNAEDIDQLTKSCEEVKNSISLLHARLDSFDIVNDLDTNRSAPTSTTKIDLTKK